MKVIAMIRVIVRAKNGGEAFAGTGMHCAQELSFRSRTAVPVLRDEDAPAVCKEEAGDINRFSAGMGREPRCSGNLSAGIAAHGVDPHNSAAKVLARCAVDPVPCPTSESLRGLACHRTDIGEADLPTVSG